MKSADPGLTKKAKPNQARSRVSWGSDHNLEVLVCNSLAAKTLGFGDFKEEFCLCWTLIETSRMYRLPFQSKNEK
ncbi:Uncharacterized protein TCM_029347 [Theobroma cacao]|uniref:Uncharacterized protein n=1 Tax=Theobroma cacao TaxID=3641 RepID=A0A061GC86_THECC|nr:Uncharacterized protein TCM_029347 [Theobroma cacao]